MFESNHSAMTVHTFLGFVGIVYVITLLFFCTQHFATWRQEQQRVQRAMNVFRLLAGATLGTTFYLMYFTRSGGVFWGGSYDPAFCTDLTATYPKDATVENTFLSKLTKLFVMSALMLMAMYRAIRRL